MFRETMILCLGGQIYPINILLSKCTYYFTLNQVVHMITMALYKFIKALSMSAFLGRVEW